jgi:lactate dehydrogenase-like 2-hydroxyacid dehydrogenase
VTQVSKTARARGIGLGIIGSGRIGTLRARLAGDARHRLPALTDGHKW